MLEAADIDVVVRMLGRHGKADTRYEVHKDDGGIWFRVDSFGDRATAVAKAEVLRQSTYHRYRVMCVATEAAVVSE